MSLTTLWAQASPITDASEQRALVEALSGAAQLGVGGLPAVISQRFSDSPEIQTTAQYLKTRYDALGIPAEVLQYDPLDAYPYYFQNTDKTYRSYFIHMTPMLQADFDGLCAGTLPGDKIETVQKRLKRVGLDQQTMCAAVSKDRVELYIRTTVAHTAAITKKMLETRSLATWPNVIALLETGRGETGARPLCVIGAHMDSVARDGGGRGPIISPATLAPGADDNGSGTAAVLTLARGLHDWLAETKPGALKCDIAILHFSGEEEGLLGSIAFAHLQLKRPVLWMVNFDMIAYNGAKTPHDAVVNVGYDKAFGRALAEPFAASVEGLRSLVIERDTFIYSSDQIAFWDVGVPAISISEQACSNAACNEPFKLFNPTLHTPDDVAAILDFDYAARIIERSYDGLKTLLKGGRSN
ncbi:MAG: M28 family peptidase [Deltaproteobacteria bacterium]|nr:M28 family peptidase [Deltaproteobacteria bacterium]